MSSHWGKNSVPPKKPASGVIRVSEAREGVSVPAPRVGTWVMSLCAWYQLLGAGCKAYASSPKLVCMCNLLANFKVDYPASTRPQVKAGVSGGQRVHAGIWEEPQARSACETSM